MTGLQLQIERLCKAVWKGQRRIDACYRDGMELLDISFMENCSPEFDELKRQQQARKEQLDRLLKKEARNGTS